MYATFDGDCSHDRRTVRPSGRECEGVGSLRGVNADKDADRFGILGLLNQISLSMHI